MDTKEQKKKNNMFFETVENKWKMSEMMNKCCEGMSQNSDGSSMMAQCMSRCKWFPLMAVIFGIALFLLGYYLDAEVTRILWMIAAGFLILMGTFCLLMMSKMIRIFHRVK
jgi:hypothetical protein